ADLLGRPRELEATGAPAARGDEASPHEDRHDLRDVELRDAVLCGDVRGLDVLLARDGAMDQDAERVAGLFGESHLVSKREAIPIQFRTIPDRAAASMANLEMLIAAVRSKEKAKSNGEGTGSSPAPSEAWRVGIGL